VTPRPWLVIPALGAIAAASALALGHAPHVAIAAGALAAAVSAAIRAYAGDQPAVLAGAAAGALVGTAGVLAAAADPARACAAGAAAAWTIAELVGPQPATARPAVALLPAAVAGALDPAYAVLVVLAGMRYWRAPQRVGRWPIAIPAAGALAVLLAVLALRADRGALATLAHAWTGAPRHAHAGAAQLVADAGDLLGPLAALAALAGALLVAARGRDTALAAVALVAGALAVSLYAGAVAPCALVLAGLAAGAATARLAALVHHPAGQACVGATTAFLLVAAPALALLR
jgi:hypothetical protein